MAWLISIHVFTTIAMTGLIWFVQIVHYPLFQKVGQDQFVAYEAAHMRLTGQVVMPLMLGELITGFFLVLYHNQIPQDGLIGLNYLMYTGFALILLNWLLTFVFFVPMHEALSREFSPQISRRLVSMNWWRTLIWSLRSLLVLAVFVYKPV